MQRYLKRNRQVCFFAVLALGAAAPLRAGDNNKSSGNAAPGYVSAAAYSNPMPTLLPGMYGSDPNNPNAGKYMCRGDSPVTLTVNIPDTNPANRSATLQMNVFDVDGDAPSPELDTVYVNGVKVGALNGVNDIWFYNVFNIPQQTLKQGSNAVSVSVDDYSAGWCVPLDWAVIALTGGAAATLEIARAWVAPSSVPSTSATPINLFAEVSGSNIASVTAYYGTTLLTQLIPAPSKDGTYSGQFVVPAGLTPGFYNGVNIKALDSKGNAAYWSGITIR